MGELCNKGLNLMKITAIIPARMAASRFPGKPLKEICGLPMIEHVRRRTELCKLLDEVIVATCDREIEEVVEESGGRVIMTSPAHERCTDRIAEAARSIEADIIVNIQGDEPLVMPYMIERVVFPLIKDQGLSSSNLMSRIADDEEFHNRNVPKVVTDKFKNLLYISREPIPSSIKAPSENYAKYKQLGIIAFRYDFLQTFCKLEPTPLEIVESVDMMRAVEHGYKVRMVEIEGLMIGVDVPSDVQRVEKAINQDKLSDMYLF